MKKHLHYLLFTLFFFLGSSYTFAQLQKGAWKTIQLPKSFESRDWAATAWTGTEFLYWGGSSTDGRPADWKKTKAKGRYVPSNGFYFTDGWRINPTTGTCKPMPPSGLPIGFYKSAWTGRYLFVFNGRYMQMKMYDAQKNVWKAISKVGLPRFQRMNLAVTWTGKEVMIWGGTNYQHTKFYNDGYLYNPETNRWRKMAPSPLISRGSPTSFNTNKEIIIYGGDHNKYLKDGAAYNPTSNTWRKITDNPYHKGHFFETKV